MTWKNLFVIVVLALAVACTPTAVTPTSTSAPADSPLPVPTATPLGSPLPAPLNSPLPTPVSGELDSPLPTPGEPIVGLATVNSVEMVILESFPVQVHAVVRGTLPDACTTLGDVQQEVAGKTMRVTIGTQRPADAICAQVLTDFEQVVSLDVLGFPAGIYAVEVNGVQASFELTQDNGLPDGSAKEGTITGTAPVESMRVMVLPGTPPQLQVTVEGNLPDGCTQVGEATTSIEGRKLIVALPTLRPARAMCITVMTPYEETLLLDLGDLEAGPLTVEVNGVQHTLDYAP